MHSALPPTYVLMRSMSVATHHARSSGHQRLALSGHSHPEKATPDACSGPRSSAILRSGIAISGTVLAGDGTVAISLPHAEPAFGWRGGETGQHVGQVRGDP